MKKVFIISFALIMMLCFLSGCNSVSGKNVEIEKYGTDNIWVHYYSICPNCGHKSSHSKEINKGESYDGLEVCDKCGNMFEYTIER